MGSNGDLIEEGQKEYEMCSKDEGVEREAENLLSLFEIDQSASLVFNELSKRILPKADPLKLIKAYIRPNSNASARPIRQSSILLETVHYIVNSILDSDKQPNSFGEDISFADICLFAEDRFRAIRQDFSILPEKSIGDEIYCLEVIIRFLILCLNEGLDYPEINGAQGLYALLISQLSNSLSSLINSFRSKPNEIKPNEAEFYSYYLIFALRQKPIEYISLAGSIPKAVKRAYQVKLALKIGKAVMSNDWVGFLKLLRAPYCNYLMSCLLTLFVKDMRVRAIAELCSCPLISTAQYLMPLKALSSMLCFDNKQQCTSFLRAIGVTYDKTSSGLIRSDQFDRSNHLIFIQTNHKYIESKRMGRTRRKIVESQDGDLCFLLVKTLSNYINFNERLNQLTKVRRKPKPKHAQEPSFETLPFVALVKQKLNREYRLSEDDPLAETKGVLFIKASIKYLKQQLRKGQANELLTLLNAILQIKLQREDGNKNKTQLKDFIDKLAQKAKIDLVNIDTSQVKTNLHSTVSRVIVTLLKLIWKKHLKEEPFSYATYGVFMKETFDQYQDLLYLIIHKADHGNTFLHVKRKASQ